MVPGHHLNVCALLSRRRYLQFGSVGKTFPLADAKRDLIKPAIRAIGVPIQENADLNEMS
jgi:hypothetical protein